MIAAEEPDTHGVEMAELQLRRPVRSAGNAAPTIPRQPQEGDHGEEVGGGAPVGWRLDLEDEVPHAKKPEVRGAVAGSAKRLASRYYQLKTGHARTG